MADAEATLAELAALYDPAIAALGLAAVARMRTRLPQANALVFDNYNALGVGFARSENASHVLLSVVLYPRWISLFFFNGTLLDDPSGLLRGEGTRIRHIRLGDPTDLARPEVESLIAQSLALAEPPLDPSATGRLIIKSVSGRRRPRRPG
jgi:hypothetical protein